MFYVNEYHDYSLLIDGSATVTGQKIRLGYVETFAILTSDSLFAYAVTVLKIDADGTEYSNLLSDSFKASYLQNCKCDIATVEEEQFNNFRGVTYRVNKVENGQKLSGLSVNVVVNQSLFNITYMTSSAGFIRYKSDFHQIINSFVINSGSL
jgi:hypothetical protein